MKNRPCRGCGGRIDIGFNRVEKVERRERTPGGVRPPKTGGRAGGEVGQRSSAASGRLYWRGDKEMCWLFFCGWATSTCFTRRITVQGGHDTRDAKDKLP